MVLMTAEEKTLLKRVVGLMEALFEYVEVVQDEELINNLKEALKEAKEGKTRPIAELIQDLNPEGDTRNQDCSSMGLGANFRRGLYSSAQLNA